jgi:hypothetical protein
MFQRYPIYLYTVYYNHCCLLRSQWTSKWNHNKGRSQLITPEKHTLKSKPLSHRTTRCKLRYAPVLEAICTKTSLGHNFTFSLFLCYASCCVCKLKGFSTVTHQTWVSLVYNTTIQSSIVLSQSLYYSNYTTWFCLTDHHQSYTKQYNKLLLNNVIKTDSFSLPFLS